MSEVQTTTRTKLTLLEEAYINELTRIDDERPITLTEAFLRVNPKAREWSKKAINNEASAIYRRPIVQRAIKAKQAMIEAERRRTSRSSRAMIEAALWKEAKGADRASDRINALKAIAAMLPEDDGDTSAADDAATREDLVAELESILSNSLGAAIDITPELPSGSEDDQVIESSDESSSDVLEVEAEVVESSTEGSSSEPSSYAADASAHLRGGDTAWDDPTPDEPAF